MNKESRLILSLIVGFATILSTAVAQKQATKANFQEEYMFPFQSQHVHSSGFGKLNYSLIQWSFSFLKITIS